MTDHTRRDRTESTRTRKGKDLIHSLDGGLDSGRGFGRIGEPASPRPPHRRTRSEDTRPKPRRTR